MSRIARTAFVFALLGAMALPPSAIAYNFWDQGFAAATVNTTFTNALLGTIGHPITYSYCLFPKDDAGTNCNQTTPATWGPTGHAWAQNGPFGAPRYWVLTLNNEPATDPCNIGPPDLSLPVSAPGSGLMAFTTLKDTGAGENFYRAHLILNMTYANPCAAKDPIPYLQFGAQDTRGNGGALGGLNPTAGVPSKVSFTAKIWDHKVPSQRPGGSSNFGIWFRLVLLAQWKDNQGRDVPRMIQVNMYHDRTGDGFYGPWKWNWRFAEDYYFPGADIAFMDAELIQPYCGGSLVPTFYGGVQEIDYDIDIQRLFKCASDHGKFVTPMPTTPNLLIRGVHWAVEGNGTNGWLWVSVHNMRMY